MSPETGMLQNKCAESSKNINQNFTQFLRQ